MRLIEISINCPNARTAMQIGEKLVTARLAACANVGTGIASIYSWQGRIERAREFPLTMKTRAALFGEAAAAATALHPWEVPAITATEITDAASSYAEWIIAETEPGPPPSDAPATAPEGRPAGAGHTPGGG